MLKTELKNEDDPEVDVVIQGSENIPLCDLLTVKHSAVYLVKKVHQDESVEASCVKHQPWSWPLSHGVPNLQEKRESLKVLFKQEIIAGEHKSCHHQDLVNSLH